MKRHARRRGSPVAPLPPSAPDAPIPSSPESDRNPSRSRQPAPPPAPNHPEKVFRSPEVGHFRGPLTVPPISRRRSPTGIARARNPHRERAPPISRGAPVSDRHRAGARNPHQRRWPRQRRSPTGIARERKPAPTTAGRGERDLAAAVRAARRTNDTLGSGLQDARRDVARALDVMRRRGPERDHGPSR